MIRSFALLLTILVSACVPFEPMDDVHVVVINSPVESDVPGNLGYFPNTQTPLGTSLSAYVLGPALPANSRVPVRVVAVHDHVGITGTINTIIATRHSSESSETPVLNDPSIQSSLGSALVDAQEANGISLGMRDREAAFAIIARYRDAFRNNDVNSYGGVDARRLIRSEP